MAEFHTPPNEHRIDTVYAFMSIDEKGFNGIVATFIPSLGPTPLVTGEERNLAWMKTLAEKVAKQTGQRIGLYTFERLGAEPIWDSEA